MKKMSVKLGQLQFVTLLGDDQLTVSAIAFWNATLAILKSYTTPVDEEYEQKLVVYRGARTEFNEQVRNHLRVLEAMKA
ncbi:hypothetical protein SAMN06296273_0430 [Nitrosomonas ureae]|uniref:Uncharacterized protein n=1 Tax=Nitrosomonas ureae TaxID=44577 RepID=A0A285BUK5_9PROT|nr:hypothetical protein [Nitrosomonas ureae]SNX58967.1 hypothetical protein SAMN06296273_0430 [Nitrosomonas ureae]